MAPKSGVTQNSGVEPVLVREYRPDDERQWLRCRVLAFLDTAYYDNVLREKERYRNPSMRCPQRDPRPPARAGLRSLRR